MTAPDPSPGLARALADLATGRTPDFETIREAFDEIMSGMASEARIAGLLLGLKVRGETPEIVAGAAAALRRAMVPVPLGEAVSAIDTCGTGGGTVTTVNISTAASLVVAAAGIPVAKHGNRSFTSRSGSADVLEALGISTSLDAAAASRAIADHGFGFLFAPNFHPAMRHVAPVRRELGVRTVMNLIGPLSNPAGVTRQIVGVSDPELGPLMIEALARLGAVRAMTVHADIGMDEIAPMGSTTIWELRDGTTREWRLDPAEFGMESPSLAGLEGGDPQENAVRIEGLLAAPDRAPKALRAAVILNAAAALHLTDDAGSFADQVDRAVTVLGELDAAERLAALRRATPFRTS